MLDAVRGCSMASAAYSSGNSEVMPGFRPGVDATPTPDTYRAKALEAVESTAPDRVVNGARKSWDGAAALSYSMGFTNPLERTEARRTFESGQVTSSFGVLIQGAVMLAVGIFVVISVFGAIPDGGEEESPLYEAQERLEELTGQAFEIAPIVLIVIVAFVIMQYVRGM